MIFTQKSKYFISDLDFLIKSRFDYIRFNYHFSIFLGWCRVSVAANGFQKFETSLKNIKFLPHFITTAPL